MRVLVVASPGVGHIFPTITTAWALRAAGHEVLFASGGNTPQIAAAGLPVVDTAPGVDFPTVFRTAIARSGFEGWGGGPEAAKPEFAARLFGIVSSHFVEHTVALARDWRPDLVMYTPLQGAGPLAAAVLGVPSVVHEISIGQAASMGDALAAAMSEDYDRFGVTAPKPDAILDVSPPSLRVAPTEGWTMRYVPYNAGAILPDWVVTPRQQRRIVVTLGSVVPQMGGVGAVRPLVGAAGDVDAEFVLALGGIDISELGALPDNVRAVDWVPLGALLRNADAVVHHGGAGTTLTSLDAGLPQFVLPHGADQFINAGAIAKAGAGAMVTPEDLTAERLTGLLDDENAAAAARGIAAEMAKQPTPADLVPNITQLV